MCNDNLTMKDKFIRDEIFTLSWSAAVSRPKLKIYKDEINENDCRRKKIKNFVKCHIDKNYIKGYEKGYKENDDEPHIGNIDNLSKKVSDKFGCILANGTFRIGISQKVLNLYLKYLWCLGEIKKPPHCPIDREVLDKLKDECKLIKDESKKESANKIFDISWTELNDICEYCKIIKEAKKIVGEDLSDWELEVWGGGKSSCSQILAKRCCS